MRVAEGHERWADEDLLRGIAGSDREAFTVFYRRHLPAVLRFLAREARDPEVAADLAAEVFAAVALASGRYHAANPTADAWLIGIARNTLGASRRRGRVEAKARRRLGYEPVELLDSDLERVQAIVDGGRGGVLGLAQALPEDERVAVHQRVVQEREYAEIAADLLCSEMVVRKRVSRGLARLRAQLREPS